MCGNKKNIIFLYLSCLYYEAAAVVMTVAAFFSVETLGFAPFPHPQQVEITKS